jgi:hypothetical protein
MRVRSAKLWDTTALEPFLQCLDVGEHEIEATGKLTEVRRSADNGDHELGGKRYSGLLCFGTPGAG